MWAHAGLFRNICYKTLTSASWYISFSSFSSDVHFIHQVSLFEYNNLFGSCPCQQPLPLRHCSSYGSCDGIKQLTSVTVTCFCVVLNSIIQYLTRLDNAFGQMFPIPLNHSFLPFKHIVTSGSEPSMARELHTTDTSGQRASPRVIPSSRYSSNTPSRQNWFLFFLWFAGRLAFKNWCYGWVPAKKLISSVIKV